MIAKFCQYLCDKYPERVREIPREGQPYLTRFYISAPRTAEDSDNEMPERFGIYLHHFHDGDKDPDFHNHPWRWALSLILSGVYYEERIEGTHITNYVRRAGGFNLLTDKTFHRVDILEDYDGTPIWTLFITGPRIKRWGFKRRTTGEYLDSTKYLEEKK